MYDSYVDSYLCAYFFSYCLSSDSTCHPMPGPALPALLQFYSGILVFILKIFQGELQSVNTW